jgi:hypothetical protein
MLLLPRLFQRSLVLQRSLIVRYPSCEALRAFLPELRLRWGNGLTGTAVSKYGDVPLMVEAQFQDDVSPPFEVSVSQCKGAMVFRIFSLILRSAGFRGR